MKPYDLNLLVEKLKANGLDVAEEAAKVVVESVLSWVEESSVSSENKVDDLLVVVIPHVKKFVLAQVDKIDSKEG